MTYEELAIYITKFNTLDFSDLHMNNSRPSVSLYNRQRFFEIQKDFPFLRSSSEFIYWVQHSKDINFIDTILCPNCHSKIRSFGKIVKEKRWGYLSCCSVGCTKNLKTSIIENNLAEIKRLYYDENLACIDIGKRFGLSKAFLQEYFFINNIKKCKENIRRAAIKKVKAKYDRGEIDLKARSLKTKATFERRYGKGITNPQQIPGVKLKTLQTAYKNGTISRSRMEQAWLNQLKISAQQYPIPIDNSVYVVDGYNPKTNTIYEFLGDFWHGNPKPITNKGRAFTKRSHRFLRTRQRFFMFKAHGYKIRYIWESDWLQKLHLKGRVFKNQLEYLN